MQRNEAAFERKHGARDSRMDPEMRSHIPGAQIAKSTGDVTNIATDALLI